VTLGKISQPSISEKTGQELKKSILRAIFANLNATNVKAKVILRAIF
jgi:hypothetical protein